MNKRKKFYLFGIGLLITIVIVSMFVNVYNKKCYWQRQVAEHNRFHWSEIHLMTLEIEKAGFTEEGIRELYLYINAKVYASDTDLSPGFGDALKIYYIALAQDISANQKLDDEKLQLAIDLFEEATIELKNLSASVLEMAANDNALELINADSDIYKQVEKMTKEYSDEYSERISNFYSSFEN